MRASWRVILLLLCMVLCLAPGYGQPASDAREVLARVAQAYRDAAAFHFVAAETTLAKAGDLEREQARRLVIANEASGRWRIEVDGATQSGLGLSDGQWTWIYLPGSGKYTKRPADDNNTGGAGPPLENLKSYFIARYNGIGTDIKDARLLREETLTVDGRDTRCLVIEAEYAAAAGAAGKLARRFWIDPTRLVILREESEAEMKGRPGGGPVRITQTISFDLAQLGEPLPDLLFHFDPPAGARLVAAFDDSGEAGATLIGQAAPAFELPDLGGKRYRLDDLRGKVVLLNFWATWCMPCRVELPLLEQLHRARANQTRTNQTQAQEALLVLGVNNETEEKARRFVEEHDLTFPNLADAENMLARAYHVESIPTTVVIGRDGKVAFYATGPQTQEQLRLALAEAGGSP
jgi:peroxiredoxin/outer membrane lipoprotein-sorting protein